MSDPTSLSRTVARLVGITTFIIRSTVTFLEQEGDPSDVDVDVDINPCSYALPVPNRIDRLFLPRSDDALLAVHAWCQLASERDRVVFKLRTGLELVPSKGGSDNGHHVTITSVPITMLASHGSSQALRKQVSIHLPLLHGATLGLIAVVHDRDRLDIRSQLSQSFPSASAPALPRKSLDPLPDVPFVHSLLARTDLDMDVRVVCEIISRPGGVPTADILRETPAQTLIASRHETTGPRDRTLSSSDTPPPHLDTHLPRNGLERSIMQSQPLLILQKQANPERPAGGSKNSTGIRGLKRMGGKIGEEAWAILNDIGKAPRRSYQVRDSNTQRNRRMHPADLSTYFQKTFGDPETTPPSPLHLIDNEVSSYPFAADITPPTCVLEADFATRLQTGDNDAVHGADGVPGQLRHVQYADRGTITPFHFDSGGASTLLWLLSGEKLILLLEPTRDRIRDSLLYRRMRPRYPYPPEEDWPNVRSVHVVKGQGLVIPGGWLHAVITIKPSVALTSTFYCDAGLSMQMTTFADELAFAADDYPLDHELPLLHYLAAENMLSRIHAALEGMTPSPRLPGDLEMVRRLARFIQDNKGLLISSRRTQAKNTLAPSPPITDLDISILADGLRDGVAHLLSVRGQV